MNEREREEKAAKALTPAGAEVQPGLDLPVGGERSLASQSVNKPEVSMGDQDSHGCVA